MWHFHSPELVFGEAALDRLETLTGRRAFIVTDTVIAQLGFVAKVQKKLKVAGLETAIWLILAVISAAAFISLWRKTRRNR